MLYPAELRAPASALTRAFLLLPVLRLLAFHLIFAVGFNVLIAHGLEATKTEPRLWEGPVAVEEIKSDFDIVLKDGQILTPASIRTLPTFGMSFILGPRRSKRVGQYMDRLKIDPLFFEPDEARFDRFGRVPAHIQIADEPSLQEILVADGAVIVAPGGAFAEQTKTLLDLEYDARRVGRGVWGEGMVAQVAAGEAYLNMGQFTLVQGRVLRSVTQKRYHYLNFGEDWRSDFTVRIEKKLAKKISKQGLLDLEGLEGQEIEIRGTIFEAGGAMIELRDPLQLTILPKVNGLDAPDR